MKLDNFLRGPLTSLIGVAIMAVASYFWFATDELTNWEAGGAGIVGFALLFMRDKLPDFISKFFNALLSKFGSQEEKKP